MDILNTIVVLIPSVLSLCVSGIYAYIALKKVKEPPRDEVWETTTKLLCSRDYEATSDDFAELYSKLKFFKEHPEALEGHTFISAAMSARADKLREQQSESDSKHR